MDLPVLIPRVKNGLPADACAQASSDRLRRLASLGPYLRVRPMGESSLRTASGSAVHFGTRAALCERQPPQMPINAVAARGGCVCAPCRPSAAVSAVRGESRRRSRRKKSAAVSVLTSSPETPPRFSCPRNPLSSGFNFALSCGRGLTRPSIAAVCAAACAHFAALPLVRSTFGLRGFPPISPHCGSSTAHPAGRGGAIAPF